MNNLLKEVLCFSIFFVLLFDSHAQSLRTEYYQWTKIVYKNGTIKTMDGKSGQFVTRHKQVCYDSDREGFTVSNGSLTLKAKQGNTYMYVGPSYYGTSTSYTFFDGKGILNIKDNEGNVYVYKKATAPSGRKTSSLIASKRNSGSGGGSSGGAVYVPPVNSGDNSGTAKSSTSQGQHTKTKHPKSCQNCAGRGVCKTCGGSGTYLPYVGAKSYTRCTGCNGTGRCRICNGTGTNGYDYY